MSLIEFQDYPSTETPLNAENLNHNFNELIPYILYENSVGSNEAITLSETSANFSYLEIIYKNNDGSFNSAKIDSPNGKAVSLTSNTASGGVLYSKNKTVKINGTNIDLAHENGYTEYRLDGSGYAYLGANNLIYITKVIGYK